MTSTTGTVRAAALKAGKWAAVGAALLVVGVVTGCRSAGVWGARPAGGEVGPVAGTTPAVVVVAPLPAPVGMQPRAPGAVEPARVPAEPGSEVCTFAVLGADPASRPAPGGFAAVWEAAQALAPRHTVILGRAGLSGEGSLERREQGLPVGLGAEAAPTVFFPGGPETPGGDRRQAPCERALLLFLSGRAVAADGVGQAQWLQERLGAARAAQPVLLFLDQPLWERYPGHWPRLQEALESSGLEVHVVAAGTGRFSWWREGRVQFHTLGWAAAAASPGSASADGAFPGLLWISVGLQRTTLRVVEPAGLLSAEVFSRRLQEERQALRDACQAGPVLAGDGITEVRCSNPTDTPLAFEATWHFEGSDGRVEPQMLGFSLEPGQAFRQRFHLQADRGLPLKFARPRLGLTTVCRDGLGRPVQVRLELAPWVRMGGEVGQLGELFMVDGNLGDWPGGGNPINHASQVVLAAQPWRGPAEFAGSLYVGEQGSRLCFALEVRREKDVDVGCVLLVDPRGTEGGAFAGSGGPLAVTVAPDGQSPWWHPGRRR